MKITKAALLHLLCSTHLPPFAKIATFFLQIKNGKKGPFLRK